MGPSKLATFMCIIILGSRSEKQYLRLKTTKQQAGRTYTQTLQEL